MPEINDKWTLIRLLRNNIYSEEETLHQAITEEKDFEELKKIESKITELQKELKMLLEQEPE